MKIPVTVELVIKMFSLRVLVIGDTHFREENIEDDSSRIEQIIELARRYKPDLIVTLGDTLHRFVKINSFTQTYAVEFLRSLRKIAPLRIIIGNHDRPNNTDFQSNVHPFTACHDWPDTIVVDKAVKEEFMGHHLLYLPYVYTGRMLESILSVEPDWETQYGKYSLVLMHQEMEGVKMGVQISTSTDKWLMHWPLAGSGHIHDYHWYQSNYVYLGSTSQQTFAESRDKAVGIFDLGNGESRTDLVPIEKKPAMESVSCLGLSDPMGSERQWKLYRFPIKSLQWIKLEMSYQEFVQSFQPNGDEKTSSGDDWCQVTLSLTHAEHKSCINLISQLEKANRRFKVKIVYTDQMGQTSLAKVMVAAMDRRSFESVIKERLEQNPRAQHLYNKLFPVGTEISRTTGDQIGRILPPIISSNSFSPTPMDKKDSGVSISLNLTSVSSTSSISFRRSGIERDNPANGYSNKNVTSLPISIPFNGYSNNLCQDSQHKGMANPDISYWNSSNRDERTSSGLPIPLAIERRNQGLSDPNGSERRDTSFQPQQVEKISDQGISSFNRLEEWDQAPTPNNTPIKPSPIGSSILLLSSVNSQLNDLANGHSDQVNTTPIKPLIGSTTSFLSPANTTPVSFSLGSSPQPQRSSGSSVSIPLLGMSPLSFKPQRATVGNANATQQVLPVARVLSFGPIVK